MPCTLNEEETYVKLQDSTIKKRLMLDSRHGSVLSKWTKVENKPNTLRYSVVTLTLRVSLFSDQ